MTNRNYLIDPNVVSHRGTITEDELRRRLLHDAYEQAGWLDGEDRLPIAGCSGSVHRGTGRTGGYTVEVRRDISKSNQPLLAGPGKKT